MTEQQKQIVSQAVETLKAYHNELWQTKPKQISQDEFELIRDARDWADSIIIDFAPYMD